MLNKIDMLTDSMQDKRYLQLHHEEEEVVLKIRPTCYSYNSLLLVEEELKSQGFYYKYFLKDKPIATLPPPHCKKCFIDDTVLFMRHPHEFNYSHFTLQCMGIYFMAKRYGLIGNKIKIAVDQSIPFQRELFTICKIKEDQIFPLEKDVFYKFRCAIYATSLYNQFYDRNYLDLFEEPMRALHLKTKIKLYITRKTNPRRATVNEDEVIDFFLEKGYEVGDFDRISVAQQIALVQSATHICAAHGASGANLVYKNKDHFKFIEYFTTNWITSYHAHLLENKNVDYTPVAFTALDKKASAPCHANLPLLEKALQTTIYSFRSTADLEVKIAEIEKVAVLATKINGSEEWEQANQYDMFGSPQKAIEILEKRSPEALPDTAFSLYMKLVFLNREKSAFDKLSQIALSKGVPYILKQLFQFALFGFELELAKDVANRLATEPGHENRLAALERYTIMGDSRIIGWHNLPLCIDPENYHLSQDMKLGELIIENRKPSIYINSPQLGLYISAIDDLGFCTLSATPVPAPILHHNEFNFSLKTTNGYLTLRPDGSITVSPWFREWERLFIGDRKMHATNTSIPQ